VRGSVIGGRAGSRADAALHGLGTTAASEDTMTKPSDATQSHQVELHEDDSDLHKGAIEGSPDGQGNPSGTGLDDQGWPNDEVAIAQDVIGANEDETTG
jgi:hypothetical protein